MRMLILSDIESLSWTGGSGSADVLISCGDITDNVILEAATAYSCAKVFAVKGNHDSPTAFPDPIVDLHLKTVEYEGIRFGGFNGSWQYKPRGHHLWKQDEVDLLLARFPAVDIFVAHNSPRGIHDREDQVHTGFDAFREYIDRHHPSFLIHGHQHIDAKTKIGNTTVLAVYGHHLVTIDPAGREGATIGLG